ncbi:MAG: hypothetical protein AAF388_17000, partial [Bacteroidota bacterium]
LLYAGQPSQAGFLNYSTNAPQETIMSVGYPQNYGNMGKLYAILQKICLSEPPIQAFYLKMIYF